jgi:hypothetical protein
MSLTSLIIVNIGFLNVDVEQISGLTAMVGMITSLITMDVKPQSTIPLRATKMSPFVYICGRGAHEREAPNFLLYHIPRNLSRVFAKKYCTNFFPKIDESLCNITS